MDHSKGFSTCASWTHGSPQTNLVYASFPNHCWSSAPYMISIIYVSVSIYLSIYQYLYIIYQSLYLPIHLSLILSSFDGVNSIGFQVKGDALVSP